MRQGFSTDLFKRAGDTETQDRYFFTLLGVMLERYCSGQIWELRMATARGGRRWG
jgi:hypothetical protein